jgi:hypothetical protein
MGYNRLFINVVITVFRRSDDSVAFKGVLKGKLYLVDVGGLRLPKVLKNMI